MEVIKGKRTFQLQATEFARLVSGYPWVAVDLGTGDGRFVYELARAHPEWFCIGIDPARENLEEYSRRVLRKPEKGGLGNVLYVIASAEKLPSEIKGLADQIHINFPWGSLLEAVILADPQVLRSIADALRPHGGLHMLINTSIFRTPIPIRVRELPELTLEYVDNVLVPAYGEAGITIVERSPLSEQEMREARTTWGKRLAIGRSPSTFYIKAEVRRLGTGSAVGHA